MFSDSSLSYRQFILFCDIEKRTTVVVYDEWFGQVTFRELSRRYESEITPYHPDARYHRPSSCTLCCLDGRYFGVRGFFSYDRSNRSARLRSFFSPFSYRVRYCLTRSFADYFVRCLRSVGHRRTRPASHNSGRPVRERHRRPFVSAPNVWNRNDVNFFDQTMDNTCTYCQDVIDSLTIVCLDCSDFQLCMTCFSHGAEIGDHKNNHGYKLKSQKSPGQHLVTKDGWTGDELMHILEFVEQYSFGCWDELPKAIKNRSPSEIKAQFTKYFLDGTIGKLTWGTMKRPQLEDFTVNFEVNDPIPHLSGLSKAQYAEIGFNPTRDEFELENDFDNNAEAVLSITSEWNDFGDDYNLACVDMYCDRLIDRTFAKEVVHDYQLMDKYFFSSEKPKRRLTQEEKTTLGIENQLKKFTRYMTENELWSLNLRLQQEYLLKKRRDEMICYRKNGITKLYDIVKFNLLHHSMVPDEHSEQSSSDVLAPAPKAKRGEKKRKKRKRPKLYRKKNHVYHRTPQYIAALNRVLSQNNDIEDDSD